MRLLLISAVLIWCWVSAAAQGGARASSGGEAPVKTGLELSASILKQQYCSADYMHLLLQLSYKNTGETDLVLFKYNLGASEWRLSRSAEDADAGRYEKVIAPGGVMVSGKPLELGDEPRPDFFIILKPGETYTPPNTEPIPIFLHEEGEPDCEPSEGSDCESGLWPGRHVLQLKVGTWPLLGDPEPSLLSRWKKFGEVWSKPLVTRPISFEVEIPYKGPLTNCNSADAQ